jgi:uncharacterized repeat protein (TIGR03806 family)
MRAFPPTRAVSNVAAVAAAAAAALVAVAPGCGHHTTMPDAGGAHPPDASAIDAPPDLALPDLLMRPLPTCRAPARPDGSTAITLVDAFPGLPTLTTPVGLTQPPGDATHVYVWQQGGELLRIDVAHPEQATKVLDLSKMNNKIVSGGEAGLLGFTFAPMWPVSQNAYLSYTTPSAAAAGFDSVLSRMHSTDDGQTWSADQAILQFGQPYTNHNGGNILFGPDGYLYAGFGDGGSGYDPQNRAQDLTLLFGKILRLDVEGQTTYAIPPTNPFSQDTSGKMKEIFAYGLRNPWRWSFDRASGTLWVGDVGQDRWEEVDTVESGGNYGWRVWEGTHCTDTSMPTCSLPGALPPVLDYAHPALGVSDGGNCVTGGYVYHGTSVPSLAGSYVFGDYINGRIWRVVYDSAGAAHKELLLESHRNISSFGEGLDGELYVVDYGGGKILRVAPGSTAPAPTFPQTLSQTSCVLPDAPAQPTAGLIPYEVNVPLWSDGADKRRWLMVPPGSKIHVNNDGDWDLPVGSVVIKEFSIGGQRIETRLLVHHDDGDWAGYTYQWRADQSDADLLVGAKTVDVGNGRSWYIPAREECLRCHTTAAGRTLGLETAQLNRPRRDGSGNQLDDLVAAGLFDAPLPSSPPALPPPDSSAPVDQRARAYLHANCSFCHRMGGPGRVPPDWRYALSLADTGACGTVPGDGDLGVTGALVIAPGAPSSSVTSLRMHALDANRMPPLATRVVDAQGTALIDAWITSLTGCN